MFVCLPLAWVWHFKSHQEGHAKAFSDQATFARKLILYLGLNLDSKQSLVCFLSIIPLEKLFDWGGEQMALYLGKELGDLVVITLNK